MADNNQARNAGTKNESNKSLQTGEGQQAKTNYFDSDSSPLDQFVGFIKGNWKPVLTELVTAGVTAYLTHDAKSKMSKSAKN